MNEISPSLTRYDVIEPSSAAELGVQSLRKSNVTSSGEVLSNVISNFYRTDPISRASKTMAKCTREWVQGKDIEQPLEASA